MNYDDDNFFAIAVSFWKPEARPVCGPFPDSPGAGYGLVNASLSLLLTAAANW